MYARCGGYGEWPSLGGGVEDVLKAGGAPEGASYLFVILGGEVDGGEGLGVVGGGLEVVRFEEGRGGGCGYV